MNCKFPQVEQTEKEIMIGVVKWFDDKKGFGFIEAKPVDIFVHHLNIVGEGWKSLSEGDRVEFDSEDSPKGPKAVNVKKL